VFLAASVARQYVMQSRPSDAFTLTTDDRRLLLMKLCRQDGLNRIALENLDVALSAPLSRDNAVVERPMSHERGRASGLPTEPGRSM
jgi:hypothetical protein